MIFDKEKYFLKSYIFRKYFKHFSSIFQLVCSKTSNCRIYRGFHRKLFNLKVLNYSFTNLYTQLFVLNFIMAKLYSSFFLNNKLV